jgi:hypothetical protein
MRLNVGELMKKEDQKGDEVKVRLTETVHGAG